MLLVAGCWFVVVPREEERPWPNGTTNQQPATSNKFV
jgi:hypothetical protein